MKGLGYVAMRFTDLDTPGAGTTRISTATIGRTAPATKQQDAVKILAPAVGGAVIGRVVDGKSGAAKGAVIGGAAGTVAKSVSAYDMAVSDAMYGPAQRYVSRQRLQAMLAHEFAQLLERLRQ